VRRAARQNTACGDTVFVLLDEWTPVSHGLQSGCETKLEEQGQKAGMNQMSHGHAASGPLDPRGFSRPPPGLVTALATATVPVAAVAGTWALTIVSSTDHWP